MRTTITIDHDVAERIEELRRSRGLSLKKIVNSLLRDGLEYQLRSARPRQFRTRTHRLGVRPGFDPAKLNQLLDELETENFTEQQSCRQG